MSALTQAIKDNIPILSYAQMCGFHIQKIGREYTLEEHDSVRINAEKNLFVRNSTGEKGTVIDFCMFAQKCDAETAIKQLRGMLSKQQIPQQTVINKSFKPKQQLPLDIPKKNSSGYKRMYAYLCKTRCIDSEVVKHLVDRQMLFEDDKHHNCVWLGYDYDGKAKFGCKRVTVDNKFMPKYILKDVLKKQDKHVNNRILDRGIFIDSSNSHLFIANCSIQKEVLDEMLNKSLINKIVLAFDDEPQKQTDKEENIEMIKNLCFAGEVINIDVSYMPNINDITENFKQVAEPYKRGDILGSKKSIGMFIDNKSPTLFVTEAPIDAMSLMTFFNRDKCFNINDNSYLVQAGTNGIDALIYHIQHQPNINKIYLCYDNDHAGDLARQNARSELQKIGYKGAVLDKIPIGNDFNDDLRKSTENVTKQQQNKKQTQQKSTTKTREIDNQC
ncbi:MAG: DUF3991 and TOPRIM domain-containing protein, partial [Oscillospiraceae bacterium]